MIGPDLLSSAESPQVAVDPKGNAIAVWQQLDGSRFGVWSNRYTPAEGDGMHGLVWASQASGCSGPECNAEGACANPSDEAIWLEPATRDRIEECGLEALLGSSSLQECISKNTGFSQMCSQCWVSFMDCVFEHCLERRQMDPDSPACADYASQQCAEGTEQCAGQPVPL